MDPHPNPEEEFELELKRRTRARNRRFLIWMAILVGLPLALICFVAGAGLTKALKPGSIAGEFGTMALGFIPLLAWNILCASNILSTSSRLSAETRFRLTLPLALVLGAASAGIVHGLFWFGCEVVGGGFNFSPP